MTNVTPSPLGDIELKKRRRWPFVAGGIVVVLAVAGGIGAAALPKGDKQAGTDLTIAVWNPNSGEDHVLQYVAKNIAPDYGITITEKVIGDTVAINRAVDDGEVDGNLFEHKPFLSDAVTAKGFKLAAVAPTFNWKFAIFSQKYKTWAQVPDGANIGLRDDPAGQSQALLSLQNAGRITLKAGNEKAGVAQLSDIATNPHHYKFTQIAIGQLARAYSSVDVLASYVADVKPGGVPESDIIQTPRQVPGFEGQLVVSSKHENDPNIKKLIKAFDDPRLQKWLKTTTDPIVDGTLLPLGQYQ